MGGGRGMIVICYCDMYPYVNPFHYTFPYISPEEHNECYAEAKLTKELIDTIALASRFITPRLKIPTL